ncbi:MAG: nitroreductase family deazaflavin-dependent oxidoreductase [Dermatophilaceae bacterium]
MTFHRGWAGIHKRYINTLARRFIGLGSLAELEHVGRRSGQVRHTPLRAFRDGQAVVIGLNFGRQSDWLRNIQAAGRCRLRLGGDLLDLGAPQVMPLREGGSGMPAWFRFGLRYLVRTRECVRLPVLASRPNGPRGRRAARPGERPPG